MSRLFRYAPMFVILISVVHAQETNCNISGFVSTSEGDVLEGATVKVVHLPTQNVYMTRTNAKGYFHIFNLKPGGPYHVSISFVGYQTKGLDDLFAEFNNEYFHSKTYGREFRFFILDREEKELQAIVAGQKKTNEKSIGTTTIITPSLMKDLPSISRNLQDYARLVPQSKVSGDGAMSFAGQNSKFNAIFIDGSNNQDLLGVSSNGIAGGQTLSPPVSMDAIEEIKILLSPYEVQFGNFTGGSLNAITRSGSNQFKSSVWYYFRNEQMAGKSPTQDAVKNERTKLTPFFNNTLGAWISGPLIRDKLFHFTSLEWQKEDQPQPFDMSEYKGKSSRQQLDALRDTLLRRYGYEPGRYDENFNNLRALRFITKIDWNPSLRHKITLTYRLNSAERQAPQLANGSTMVRYLNNGYQIFSNTHVGTFEWRSFLNSKLSSRFLVTYTDQKDDRQILGKPFPAVNILDGPGTIVLGASGASQVSLFKGKDLAILQVFKLIQNRQVFTLGTDLGFSWMNDLILSSYYGNYQYKKLEDFLSNAYPSRYSRTLMKSEIPVNDQSSAAGAKFMTSRLGFFIQDEYQFNPDLRLRFGVRVDGNSWNTDYPADEYFNTVAIPSISAYYDLKGARSGSVPKTHWQMAPRLELAARIPDENVTLKFGTGIFTGHILNIWASEIYNYQSASLDITPALFNLTFNPDVVSQPGFKSLGLDPEKSKGNIVVAARNFKYPTVWRMSSSIEKRIGKGWNTGIEFLLTRNLHEIRYTNVNILPPVQTSAGAGSRSVYSVYAQPPRVPMSGGNPYSNILLLGNSESSKGYSYSLSAVISSPSSLRSAFTASYTFGNSKALFEPTGVSGPNFQQWRSLETINGRNSGLRSISDFDLAHRVYVYGMRKFIYAGGRVSTTVSLFYQGQSGQPYSYVYERSMVNDHGQNESFDLIYVPTSKELQEMRFIPIIENDRNYTTEQQKEMLEKFIQSDHYLNSIRGSFSQRNKARLPFTHTVDIRIQQEFMIKTGKSDLRFGIHFDVFNFLNMLNHEWGRIYVIPGDNFALVRFDKFVSANDLTPQYQFFPVNGKPWSVQTSTAPGNSARWISQLGFRFYL
ncbi:MAG TPA: carboxypeptidase regulatory-like domain-containing protein [Chitinophagaceae bacterium]|nr:carboxypeptidase regulatory-like domain-containing protein [Chitinophagaceae bacterium]